MQREVLRILHAGFGQRPNPCLRNFSFSFRTEETVCFWGYNLMDILALKALLRGKVDLEQGKILQNGRRCEVRELADTVFMADGSTLVDTLPVYENLFVLRKSRKKLSFRVYKKEVARIESITIFDQLESKIDIDQPVKKLSEYDRVLVSMAQAAVSDAALVVVDLTPMSLRERDYPEFCRYLRYLQSQGKGVILFLSRPISLLRECNRSVLLVNGAVRKVFWQGEMVDDHIWKETLYGQEHRSDTFAVEPQSRGQKECLRILDSTGALACTVQTGEMIGIWDYKWQLEQSAAMYMKGFLDQNYLCVQKQTEKKPLVDFDERHLKSQRIAVVSGNVVRQTFPNLSPMETLAIPIYPMLSNSAGVIRENLVKVLWEDMTEEFDFPKSVESIGELTPSQRMLLLWFRSYFVKANIVLFESPERFLDASSIRKLQQFHRKQPEDDKAYFLFSHDLAFLKAVCTKIIVAHEGIFREIMLP